MKLWKTAGATMQGTSHRATGAPCQDSICFANPGSTCSAIALADGAGTAQYAHIGASVATSVVCQLFVDSPSILFSQSDEQKAQSIIRAVVGNIRSRAESLVARIHDFDSTLLFVVASGARFLAWHLGDGVVSKLTGDGVSVLSLPERGEFANETFFVTRASAARHFRIIRGSLDNIRGFIIMSDGAAEALFDKNRIQFGLAVEKILGWLDENTAVNVSAAVAKNMEANFRTKTHDDCGVAIMKQVRANLDRLEAWDFELQAEFLGCKRMSAIANRKRFLDHLSRHKEITYCPKRLGDETPSFSKNARKIR